MRKGHPGRKNAKCPNCGSLERHRLIWLYFQRRTNLLEMPRKRLLHIAPEACLETLLREHPAIDYLSGDLESPWHPAMVIMDITDIKDFKEGDFDVVYCSHVLEHVPEDQKAINELYRVLAPGGWAIDMPGDDIIGAGGLLTTVGDWLRWNDALTTRALGAVSDSLVRRMRLTSGREIQYALGLVVSSYRGLRELAHSGSTAGYSTYLARYPDAKLNPSPHRLEGAELVLRLAQHEHAAG